MVGEEERIIFGRGGEEGEVMRGSRSLDLEGVSWVDLHCKLYLGS